MRTYWHCDRCMAKGSIAHAKDAGVWEVYQRIVSAHAKKAERQTGCDTGVSNVRVCLHRPVTPRRRRLKEQT